MKETSDKPQVNDILHNAWPEFLKIVEVIKNKEHLTNCHSQEEANLVHDD
jgi:hypothetical protein